MQKRRAVVFLISDFLAPQTRQTLALCNSRHDLIAVTVTDPREQALPDVGFISLVDAETGQIVELDTRHPQVRALFAGRTAQRAETLSAELRKVGVDELAIRTDEDYLKSLRRFFHMRERRFRLSPPKSRGQRGVVGHHDQYGLLPPVQFQQKGRHHFRRSFIQVSGRLVAKQQVGTADQGASQRDSLVLATREFRGTVIQPVLEPHLLEQFSRALRIFGAVVRHQRRNKNVLEHRALGQQAMVLEDEADGLVAKRRELFFRNIVRVDSVKRHRAGCGRLQPAGDVEQRALARSPMAP